MNGCMRCGEKLSHNYLVSIFTTIKEERKRIIVCSKCKEILNKKEDKEKTAPKQRNSLGNAAGSNLAQPATPKSPQNPR